MKQQNDGMCGVLRDMCGGSAAAFDLFYARYAPLVMQVALRMISDKMEAEDVCHDVFIEVLRRGESYDPLRGSLESWLAVMTRSRCLDRMRRSKRVMPGEIGERRSAPSADAAEELALSHLQQQAVRDALHALPEHQRQAVVGSYFTPRTQRELSSAWNVPLGTVKSWVRYGLNNMRKQLEKRGWAAEAENGAKEARR
ncbi:sigma-70 family RNA polymerase sigma factor [Paenibacillus humicola]|uniref:sigma-70 family RNA polymerase sigma factor n=1 Tax=Paenibacillus humicola TaxID=3110540 RepID=UPI00237BEB36|nr:sigma-70 family RNA polymerase sigma factor [Paenibacillus humicola]